MGHIEQSDLERRRSEFTTLYQRHAGDVSRHIRLWISDDEAEEVEASTWTTAWIKFDRVRPETRRAWLFGVARNHVRNRLRSQRRQLSLADAIRSDRSELTVDMFADAADPADVEPLMRAMERLSSADQEVLALTAWEGLSNDELAIVLDTRPATARVRLHRARRRLETNYRRELDEGRST